MMGGGTGPGGGRGGWANLPFVGAVLGAIGLLGGGLVYLARGGPNPASTDPAIADLEKRYARGEVDGEEYRRRRARLEGEE